MVNKIVGKKTGDRKFRLEKDSQEYFFSQLDKLKIGDSFEFKFISEKEKRSMQQLKYWYGSILPACQYFLDEFGHCCHPKVDVDNAHYNSKILFCMNKRPDLIEVHKIRNMKTKKIEERAVPFSYKLNDMKKKDANEFINYFISLIEVRTGMDINKAINSMDLTKGYNKT